MKFTDIQEALSATRKEKGEVSFRSSTPADQHIRNVIAKISEDSGVPEELIDEFMENDISRLKEVQKYSPFLFDTLLKNSAESAAFSLINRSEHLKNMKWDDVKFDPDVMFKLIKLIQLDHRSWFQKGLRAPRSYKRINSVRPIFVPSNNPEYKKFNDVTTAAATASGEFIFNVPFMQRLINYGNAIGIEAKGKKYVSQGGTIPDAYSYIEFLVIHELMHYAWGDFAAGKKYKQYHPTAHNWASDFRSNYILVKNGYTQLPMGLFSDDINLDRPETDRYSKLIKFTNDEMMKLPPNLRQWAQKEFETDEHPTKKPNPPQGGNDQQPEPKAEIKEGSVVQHKLTGTYLVVTKLKEDGSVAEVRRATQDEITAAKQGSM